MPKSSPVLSIEGLRAGYGKKEILRGVSLDVASGEIVGIIGANGAGKSTLLKTIFGLLGQQGERVEGEILFEGRDVTRLNPSKKAPEGVSYVLQGGEVFSNLSVEDNLSVAFQPRTGADSVKQKEFVYGLFPTLYPIRKRRAGLLSGGQRQTLAIGLILMASPKLLLLDEPTASLSVEAAEIINKAIAILREKFKLAILLVEQNIDQCLSLSDRIYLMKEGKIVDVDTPVNIVNENKLEQLFGVKTKFQNN